MSEKARKKQSPKPLRNSWKEPSQARIEKACLSGAEAAFAQVMSSLPQLDDVSVSNATVRDLAFHIRSMTISLLHVARKKASESIPD